MKAFAISAAWVAAFALLVYPTTRDGSNPAGVIATDATHYLAMVTGDLADAPAPFAQRIGAPLVARLLPFTAETSLFLITLVSLTGVGWLWLVMGRRLGYSNHALALAAIATCSTQGWVGLFNNPYLTDAPGLLGITAAWSAWMVESYGLALAVLAVAPLFRETVAPMAALWLVGEKWKRGVLALGVAAAPLLLVRMLPGLPQREATWAVMGEVLARKGPLQILGDVFASYHALWFVALVGIRLAAPERARRVGVPLALLLFVAAMLSLVAVNTVRMFTLAIPFVALAVAELFEALLLKHRVTAWAVAGTYALGWFVWVPTRPLGAWISDHKVYQYVFAALALGVSVIAWRKLTTDRRALPAAPAPPATLPRTPEPSGSTGPSSGSSS